MEAPVKILVDSTAGISAELAHKWGMGVVPLYLTWGNRTYRDGEDLLPKKFYSLLAHSETNPKSSAPTPADFIAACQVAFRTGHKHVLIITVTPNMSATYNNACLAAKEIGTDKVSVLDSGQGAGAQALIAACAARKANSGAQLADVLATAETSRQSTEIYMVVDTLKYLRRSGRISGPQAFLGELIQMKPILTFVAGRLTVIAKPRTMRRATSYLIERLMDSERQAGHVMIMYADQLEPAIKLSNMIRQCQPNLQIDVSPVSGVVGGHSGPGLLGLAMSWCNDLDEQS